MIYLVTRHAGALEWMQAQVTEPVQHIAHLDDNTPLFAGDCVAGSLPIHQVAALNARGVRYLHLCVNMPAKLRGQELTSKQLHELNAYLQEYSVRAMSSLNNLLED
jgi:CRISPR-associated protein Csx16